LKRSRGRFVKDRAQNERVEVDWNGGIGLKKGETAINRAEGKEEEV
jgi:hypothetical protein